MRVPARRVAVLSVLLPFVAGGCVVLGSKYEAKTREADTLRDAVAAANREKSALEARIEALSRQLSEEKENAASLAARLREQEEAARKAAEELAAVRKNYEGTRLTREQLITELLEKEKATGKRIQELGLRAQRAEAEAESRRKELEARDAEIAKLRAGLAAAGQADAIRRERDVLLGRVERLLEERAQEARRRDDRFAALSAALAGISKDIVVEVRGASARIVLPEKFVSPAGRAGALSKEAKDAVALAGKTAAEFPESSVVVFAPGKKAGGEIRAVLVEGGRLADRRVILNLREKDRSAEIHILVP